MPYDKFFLSYSESNAEDNWNTLLKFHPDSKRIHGIKGMKIGYLTCQELATTEYFWTIEGDTELIQNLDSKTPVADKNLIMFRSIDSMFDWHLKMGSVKLWKTGTLNPNIPDIDYAVFATGTNYLDLDDPCGIHHYANTPFEAWSSIFRICIKALTPGLFRPSDTEHIIGRYREGLSRDNIFDKKNMVWIEKGYNDALALRDRAISYINLIHDYNKLYDYYLTRYKS